MSGQTLFVHGLFAACLNRQFEPNTIRVKEIDAFEHMVIGHAQDLNAVGLQTDLGILKLRLGVYSKGDVVDPNRGVGGGKSGFIIPQIEKCNEGAVHESEEKVRVGAIFSCAWHVVTLDNVVKRQAQNVFVKMTRLFCILGAVSIMVQLLDGGSLGQGAQGGPLKGCGHGGFQ